jgi:hypothetical protein
MRPEVKRAAIPCIPFGKKNGIFRVLAVEKVLSVAGTGLRANLLPDRESYQSRLSCAQLGVSAVISQTSIE